jgi:hypothetical protein
MPTLQRLADDGLMYSQWHTTALCSPTRSCGEGLSIGRDSGDPVSKEYTAQFPFAGGRIVEVEVNIGDDVYLDVEREFAAAMARD